MTRAGILSGGGLAFIALVVACVVQQRGRLMLVETARIADVPTVRTAGASSDADAELAPMLRAEFDGTRLILAGRVPDAALRDEILANARRLYGAARVVDRLGVVPSARVAWLSSAFPPDLRETRRAIALLQDGQLLVSGDTETDSARSRLDATLRASAHPGWRLDLRLNASEVETGETIMDAPPRRTTQTSAHRPAASRP